MMRVGFALLVAGAIAGCAGDPPASKPVVPDVRVARVGATTAAGTFEAVGTVGLRRETTLGFTSAGRIAALRVEDGDAVRRGQLLAALDSTVVASDLSTARAERDRAAAEYARSSKLLEQGWVTRPRVESARATLAAADARVRSAGFQSSNAVIVAPGPGRILARLVEPGQVVAAGTPVLVLGEESGGYVLRVPLTDRAAGSVTMGAPVSVILDALGATPLQGQIVEIAGRADRATGTFVTTILLPAATGLRAGQVGRAVIVSRAATQTLSVPPAAVFAPRAGEAFVFVYDAGAKRVKLRKVAIADATDRATSIVSGLRPGELVATSRVDRLSDNMAVRAIGPTR